MSDTTTLAARQAAVWLPWIVGAVCLAPFYALLSPDDRVVSDPWRDYGALHLPLREFAREELLAGRLPLWNSYFGCGQPLHAGQQASLCYPLLTPLVILCGANYGLKVGLLLHLAICFGGAYCLARRLGISCWGACYTGLVAAWSGAMLGRLAEGHVSVVVQAALAPWFMLALIGLLDSPGPLAALRLAVIAAMFFFAGHPQVLYYMLLVGAFWAAGALAKPRGASSNTQPTHSGAETAGHEGLAYLKRPGRRWRCAAWMTVAAMTALLLSAVQLLPTLELMGDGLAASGRGSAGFGGMFALDGADSARLLLPYLNGNPFARWQQFDAIDHYHERVIYLGLAAPLLAAVGLTRASVAGWQWRAAWLVVLSLAIAYGESTPAFSLLGRALPGLCLFRCPGRVFCVTSIFVALLAGRGLDALAAGERGAPISGLLGFAAVALAAGAIPAYAAGWNMPEFDWDRYVAFATRHFKEAFIALGLIVLDMFSLLAVAKGFRLRGAAVHGAFLALTAADLGYFNVQCFRLEPPAETTIRADLLAKRPPLRFVEAAGYPYLDYNTLRYSRFVGAAVANHRATVGVDDGGVLPGATARLFRAIAAAPPTALAVAACDYACSPSKGAWRKIERTLPRVRFVPGRNADVLTVPLESLGEAELERLRAPAGATANLLSSSPRHLEVEVVSREAGWLVVADTFYPGWRCSVDSAAVPIEPAHGVFRRVLVPPGRHHVVMVYQPKAALLGALGTALGAVLFGALMAISRTERCRSAAPRMTGAP